MPIIGIRNASGGTTCKRIRYAAPGFVSLRPAMIKIGIAMIAKIQKLGLRNPSIVNRNHALRRIDKSLSEQKSKQIGFARRKTQYPKNKTTMSSLREYNTRKHP